MSIDKKCHQEICALHKLFEDWFVGRVENTPENFQYLSDVLAQSFEIVFPDGRIFSRNMIIEFMAKTHARYTTIPFSIVIKNYRGRALSESLHLTTYEEWQIKDGKNEVKLSTAIFQSRENAPCGVEWLHVHEVYLPQ